MRKFLMMLTMVAFCASPMAFGAPLTAEQLYKSTYIQLQQGQDSVQVLRGLIESAKKNNMDVKQVLEAAVAKGWMSQEQLNTVLDVAAKNANMVGNKELVEKLQNNRLSAADLAAVTSALKGQVTGAAYHCGYYGCYYHDGFVTALVVLLVIALLLTPVYVVVY